MSRFFHDISKARSTLLREMLDRIRACLEADDKETEPAKKPYDVRSCPDWKRIADDMEEELSRRGEQYEPVQW